MTKFGLPNYTGPYISNGRFQESVEFGDIAPKDDLDKLSRLHDSAYAKYSDRTHRTVADKLYYDDAKQLGLTGKVAATAVWYGNHAIRTTSKMLVSNFTYGPLGLLIGGLENAYDYLDLVLSSDKVREEILDYFETDPHKQFQLGSKKKQMGNESSTNAVTFNNEAAQGSDFPFGSDANEKAKYSYKNADRYAGSYVPGQPEETPVVYTPEGFVQLTPQPNVPSIPTGEQPSVPRDVDRTPFLPEPVDMSLGAQPSASASYNDERRRAIGERYERTYERSLGRNLLRKKNKIYSGF